MWRVGYRTYVAEQRGKKLKKKLEIDPSERSLVELIFRLYMEGDGPSEPLGIDLIVKWLRRRGYMHRSQHFHTGLVYAILTREPMQAAITMGAPTAALGRSGHAKSG